MNISWPPKSVLNFHLFFLTIHLTFGFNTTKSSKVHFLFRNSQGESENIMRFSHKKSFNNSFDFLQNSFHIQNEYWIYFPTANANDSSRQHVKNENCLLNSTKADLGITKTYNLKIKYPNFDRLLQKLNIYKSFVNEFSSFGKLKFTMLALTIS